MEGYVQLLIGILFLLAGVPVGNFLAEKTKEELAENQKRFRTLIIISVSGSVAGIILKNDIVLFSFLFIAIVTSRSLRKKGHISDL